MRWVSTIISSLSSILQYFLCLQIENLKTRCRRSPFKYVIDELNLSLPIRFSTLITDSFGSGDDSNNSQWLRCVCAQPHILPLATATTYDIGISFRYSYTLSIKLPRDSN